MCCQTDRHLIQDRESDKLTVSIAATGFGFYAIAAAAMDGYFSQGEALAWINEGMDFVRKTNPAKNRGWLYHFITPQGEPKFNQEVSTVDTALYYLAARKAATRLGNKALQERVEAQIRGVDASWMMQDGLFRHGLIWKGASAHFLICRWDEYNEGVLIYRLFNKPFVPHKTEYNLPLFTYYYPLCFYDDENYKLNLRKAISWQMKAYNHCGVTACDGPHGYCVNDPSVISPLSIWASAGYSSEAKGFLDTLPVSRTTPSYSGNWRSLDRIGIDHGSCLMLLR